jgi:hypothetical protein
MNTKRKIILILIGLALISLMVQCSRMEPSQSLSDIQTPEQAVSNAPTASSQRLYQQILRNNKSEK